MKLLMKMYDWSSARLEGIRPGEAQRGGVDAAECGRPRQAGAACPGQFQDALGQCEFKASAAEGGNFIVPVWRNGSTKAARYPVDPVPDYIPPREVSGADAELAKRYRSA